MESKLKYHRLILLVLFIPFLFVGCIEHRFFYRFDLDGVCDFDYVARGDSLDIYDPPGSFPAEPLFQVQTRTEVDSSGTETYILEAHTRIRGDSLPRTLGLKEVPWTEVFLKHPAHLARTPLFFAAIYKFEGIFKGRNRTEIEGERWKYIPQECHILENDADSTLTEEQRLILEEKYAAGMIIWNTERYKLRMREIIQRALTNRPDLDIPPKWIDSALVEVDAMIQVYAASKQLLDLDLSSLEWWEELSPVAHQIISENLNVMGDTTLKADLISVAELLEMRHQVTEDLLDENFEIHLDLPGRFISDNSEVMEAGILIWKFDGEEIVNDDFQMHAVSLYLFGARIIGFLVLLLAIFLAVILKRQPNKPEQAEPPAASPHDSIPPTGHG